MAAAAASASDGPSIPLAELGGGGRASSSSRSEPDVGGAFAGRPSCRLGPLELHAAGLSRHFRVRQRFALRGRCEACLGLSYDLASQGAAPTGALAWRLSSDPGDTKSRLELSDAKGLLLRRGGRLVLGRLAVGVAAEASLRLRDLEAGLAGDRQRLVPRLHLSLEHVKPWGYELAGIAAVLALNLPLALNNQEAELPLPLGLGRLALFARGSLRRTGYAAAKLGAGEASLVLDL